MRRGYFKNPNFYLMLFADAAGIAGALAMAYALRFDFFRSADYSAHYREQMLLSIPVLVALKLIVYYSMGLYSGMWRFTSLRDIRKIAGSVFISFLIIIGVIAYKHRFQGFSRSVYMLDAFFTFIATVGIRVMVRECFASWKKGRMVNPFSWISDPQTERRRRVVVIGAGYCGESLLRELSSHSSYEVVCCIDDDPKKRNRTILGVRIVGGIDRLQAAAGKYEADLILIAISRASGDQMRHIIEMCETTGLPFKRIPTAGSIADGDVSLKELRDIDYEDLLGRLPIKLDHPSISTYLAGKTVFVTGAGGSIGSELVRQIVSFNPEKLVLIEAGEENLFNIQMELKNAYGFDAIVPALARVQDEPVMRKLFQKYQPDVVFHAAAYKHVPLVEMNPWQAVENNILGSYTVMACAAESHVSRFVLVSTDKAVRPTNVMGASKRVTELIMQAMSKSSETVFMTVRFGNVLGSSGSVIPLFRRQIERGGPVTVTHPEMTRYFMLIPEAARLILQAGALAEGGEIFILEMGTPVKIADMARDLIRLSGKEPDVDVRIEFTGMRPGEKLYEELITDGEGIVPTQYEKIMVLRPENQLGQDWIDFEIPKFISIAASHDAEAIKEYLKEQLPEYQSQPADTVL